MRVDAFFEGGGVLGICFAGAYRALSDREMQIDRAMGISAGSMVASLITAHYSPRELFELLSEIDFSYFRQKTKTAQKNIIGKPLSLLFEKGIYDSSVIEEFMDYALKRKGIYSFKDVTYNNESRLKIIATDITNRRLLLFPNDLPRYYGINPEYFSIPLAVRMSSAIPFYYTPVELLAKNKGCYVVDGGVCVNIPSSLISDNETLNKIVLRFRIDCKKRIISKLKKIEFPFVRRKEEPFEKNIVIEVENKIKPTDFGVTRTEIEYLYETGYNATINFIKNGL